jgi:hypothetical protein
MLAPQASQTGSNRLPVLAAIINERVAAIGARQRLVLEDAIVAGEALTEAKAKIPHGEWLKWLRAYCPGVSERSAQVWMRLARDRHKLDALKNESTADLTIAAAVALVGKPRPERPHGLPGQLDMLGGPEVPPPSVPSPEVDRTADDLIDKLLRAAEEEGVPTESLLKALRRRLRRSGAVKERPQPVVEDAISALVNLGYRQPQARAAVAVAASGAGQGADAALLIRLGLKDLAARSSIARPIPA